MINWYPVGNQGWLGFIALDIPPCQEGGTRCRSNSQNWVYGSSSI